MTCAFPPVRKNYLARCPSHTMHFERLTFLSNVVAYAYAETQRAEDRHHAPSNRHAPQTESADEPGRGWARPTYAGAPAGWPAPDPSLLEDGRPVVPAFPLDTLPQPWREWVSDTAGGAGAPVDYVAQAVLGAVAGLCGAGVKACVTQSWSEPLVLWQALVGAPSAGKTPALDAIGRPLASVEKLLQRDGGAGASPERSRGRPRARRKGRRARCRSRRADTIRCRPSARRVAVARRGHPVAVRPGPGNQARQAARPVHRRLVGRQQPSGQRPLLASSRRARRGAGGHARRPGPRAFSSPGPARRHRAAFQPTRRRAKTRP